MNQHAIVIDRSYDAVLLRDLLLAAARQHARRAAKATRRSTAEENTQKYKVFTKYADRCEHIRLQEAKRISASLGVGDA